MLLQQKMQEIELSPTGRSILDFIINHQDQISDYSLKDLACATFTSPSTVVRAVQRLGYKGWPDFKQEFLDEVEYLNKHFKQIDANRPFEPTDNIMTIAGKISQLACESISDTMELLHHDDLQKAVQILKKSDNISIFGINLSMGIAENFRYRMMRIGKRVTFMGHRSEEVFQASMMTPKDCAIVLSYSGETNWTRRVTKYLKAHRIPIIVITTYGDNFLRRKASCTLTISTRERLYSKIGSFTSDQSFWLIFDILYACYFASDYQNNWDKRIRLSKDCEPIDSSESEIIKEEYFRRPVVE